jgi:hypothetical protein
MLNRENDSKDQNEIKDTCHGSAACHCIKFLRTNAPTEQIQRMPDDLNTFRGVVLNGQLVKE